ncbi:hypothetical protein O3P69_020739 [Scylla paramamosain]|uniref:Phospholipid-transporting ATPase n=1 Tax=Scylla paramamosain TaxID=85552 RepID=A0AAW0TML9_SCYPA
MSTPSTRTVYLNRRPPPPSTPPSCDLTDAPVLILPHYPSNLITTAKYTLVNFLPKNLFEQFRRLANFYFLCLAIIHSTIDSPVSPLTSILPLIFVVSVTAVKQGYEDWLRHREDNKVNNAPATVLRDGRFTGVRWHQISVGDVVKVSDGEEFPCDLLLLASSDPEAKCDVITANLDGETNLKVFVCPSETRELKTEDHLWSLHATVQCQLPHANLYDFKGSLEMYQGSSQATMTPLATENLLLRGARLTNTAWVYGLAIYTGRDTKMALNSKLKNNKISIIDKSMNYFLVFFLVLMVAEIVTCTALKYSVFSQEVINTMWYLDYPKEDSVSFLVIFSYIIPVSLYVTLEMQKFLATLFLQWDEEVTGAGEDEAPKVNTSDLNEELGQVEFLFSDKTGTLTENIMSFRRCSVGGRSYMDADGRLHVAIATDGCAAGEALTRLPEEVVTFLETLALCHTVRVVFPSAEEKQSEAKAGKWPEQQNVNPEYHASSTDEKALVEACARYGVVFLGQREDQVAVEVCGKVRRYTRLQILEFDSDRKCMSVVVREEWSGRLWLLTKGAESSVLRRCRVQTDREQRHHDATAAHIDDYALLGLRTLAVGRREINDQQYQLFATQLFQARMMMEGREEAVRKVKSQMEAELTLLGATGVEDLLQEGVQETLESLRVAGIKVWVLTGDKVETAVNIAYSCGHFKKFMTVLSLTGLQDAENAAARLQQCTQEARGESSYGLVVDGTSLLILLRVMAKDFYELCRVCQAVVCCRMSPHQKAETVKLVKNSKDSPRCAAVGDGANDVSMIQEAHLGIGVMGREGRQAVRCSDVGLAKFKFLQKVLFVHGHWNYVRMANFVNSSFYKNIAFNTPMVFYSAWSAYSTQSVYEGFILTMFNITCTTLPTLVYGLFEQDIPADFLLSRPHLYQRLARNALLAWTVFLKWNLFGLWHAVVMYFGLMLACQDDTCGLPDGQTPDLYLFGMALGTLCTFVVNFKIFLEANHWNLMLVLAMLVTALGYALFYVIYSGLPVMPFVTYGIYFVYYRLYESPALNLTCLLLGVTCLLPDLLEKDLQILHRSRDEADDAEEKEKKEGQEESGEFQKHRRTR